MLKLDRLEIEPAVVGLVNNFEDVIIPIDEFICRIPRGRKKIIIQWFVEKGLLEKKKIENCGTVKEAWVVAWTQKGKDLKNKPTDEIYTALKTLNESGTIN